MAEIYKPASETAATAQFLAAISNGNEMIDKSATSVESKIGAIRTTGGRKANRFSSP